MNKFAVDRGDARLVQQLAEYQTQTETELGIIDDLLQYVEKLNVPNTLANDAGLNIINRLLNYAENMVDADRKSKQSVHSKTGVTLEPNEPNGSDKSTESDESDEKPESVKG